MWSKWWVPLALRFHVQSLLLAIFTLSCTPSLTHKQKSICEKEGLLQCWCICFVWLVFRKILTMLNLGQTIYSWSLTYCGLTSNRLTFWWCQSNTELQNLNFDLVQCYQYAWYFSCEARQRQQATALSQPHDGKSRQSILYHIFFLFDDFAQL